MTDHHKFMRVVEAQERDLKKKGVCAKRTVVCAGTINGELVILSHNRHKSACDCHTFFPDSSPNVTHAEVGAINAGCDTLYITYQPCPECAEKIIESRTVQAVYYRDEDSKASTESIDRLRGVGIYVNNEWLK